MQSYEEAVLYFLNQTIASPTMDTIMNIFTNVKYWYVIYALGAIFTIYKYKAEGVRIVIGALLLVAITDTMSTYLLKPLSTRERPSELMANGHHVVEWIRLPLGEKSGPSFPSNHALNNFAVATFFALCYPYKKIARTLIVIAIIISIGRVYEGVHYPIDIVGGALIGMLMGTLFGMLYGYVDERRRGVVAPLAMESVGLTDEDTGAIDMGAKLETKRLWLAEDKK